MCERRVNRLPVVKDGKLVGIVTRADLVRAFTRTDAEIERELREDVLARTMWVEPGRVELEVRNGVVTLTGRLHTGRTPSCSAGSQRASPACSRWHRTCAGRSTTRRGRGRRALEQPVR